jgi:AcrR family transcriptional regulator
MKHAVTLKPALQKAMGRSRRTRKPKGMGHERHHEIIAAARRLFLKHGYENFTTRKLAERVGLSQTGLYVYFKSKDELLDAVCRATFAGLVERFREIAAKRDESADLLRRLIEAYVQFGVEHPDEYLITFMVGRSAPKFVRRKDPSEAFERQGIGVQLFLLFREQIVRMIETGRLRQRDATLVTQAVWAAAHGLVSLMIARPGYLISENRALVATMVSALLEGLRRQSIPAK